MFVEIVRAGRLLVWNERCRQGIPFAPCNLQTRVSPDRRRTAEAHASNRSKIQEDCPLLMLLIISSIASIGTSPAPLRHAPTLASRFGGQRTIL